DRPGRGSGAQGIRGDQRARRRAGRDGDRLPARQDPGRVDVLRAPETRWQLSDRRRQYLPQSARRYGTAAEDRATTVERGREAVAAEAVGGVSCAQRQGRAESAGA